MSDGFEVFGGPARQVGAFGEVLPQQAVGVLVRRARPPSSCLLEAGFPRPDAEAWADGSTWLAGPSIIAAQAIAYDDHGIPLDQAITWHEQGFDADEATCFYDHCYTPAQAATVTDLADQDSDIDEWLATGLPADRVIAYLRAGVTLNEYADFENNEGTTETLTMLAGLLQAP